MSLHTFDVIVIGAGVEGSATAYYLTSRYTSNVLLLEQFEANQLKGSSQGGSRCYHTDYSSPTYIKLVKDSLPLWKELEEKSGRKLLWNYGALAFNKNNDPSELSSRIESLTKNNVPHKVLSASDIKHCYPNQLKGSLDHHCIYLPCGAAINAHLSVKTMQIQEFQFSTQHKFNLKLQELFVRNGGDFKDCHRVTGLLTGGGSLVTVETDKNTFTTKRIVLATGAWTNKLLHSTGLNLELEMKIFQTDVYYFKVLSNPNHFDVTNFPIFFESIISYSNAGSVYGIPILEIPNMIKVCQFYGDGDIEVNVDEITQLKLNRKSLPVIQRFIKDHFQGVDYNPAICETCVYATTPDFSPYIDTHPDHPNVVIASVFSHGFKMSPVYGKIIAEMAMEQSPTYDLSQFKIDRKQ